MEPPVILESLSSAAVHATAAGSQLSFTQTQPTELSFPSTEAMTGQGLC